MAAVFGMVMAMGSTPLAIPDSYELIQEGRCMLGFEMDPGVCASINPAYWTPGWSLPVGLLSAVTSPFAAAGAVSLLAMALLVVPCWSLGRRFGAWQIGFLASVMLVCTPALRTYGMLADGRGLSVLCLFSSWALALRSCEERHAVGWALGAGAVAGLGALVRPEGLLTLLLVPLFVLCSSRSIRSASAALVGGVLTALPWWLSLSNSRGRFGLTPRDWEGSGFSLLEILPKREVLELYGMGAYDTPFRTTALQFDVAISGVGLDLPGGIEWLGTHLLHAVPWWGWIMALVGVVCTVRARRWRVLIALLLTAAPAFVAAFKPQSRDVLLPMANFLPVIVCAWILGSVGVVKLSSWILNRWQLPARIGLMPVIVLGFCVTLEGPRVDLVPSTELLIPGRAASDWLRSQEVYKVRASFESAPVIHMADQQWDPWPSRWDSTAWSSSERVPDFVLFTDLDDYASPADYENLTPVAYFGDDRAWVLIMSLVDSSTSENR